MNYNCTNQKINTFLNFKDRIIVEKYCDTPVIVHVCKVYEYHSWFSQLINNAVLRTKILSKQK